MRGDGGGAWRRRVAADLDQQMAMVMPLVETVGAVIEKLDEPALAICCQSPLTVLSADEPPRIGTSSPRAACNPSRTCSLLAGGQTLPVRGWGWG